MADDIVTLLRAVADYAAGALSSDEVSIAQRAADEIERLRAENALLHGYIATADAYFHEHGWESLVLLEARRAIAGVVERHLRRMTEDGARG